jgi:hypothetical protein
MARSDRAGVEKRLVDAAITVAMAAHGRPRERSRQWYRARYAGIYLAVCGFSLSRRSVARAIGIVHARCNEACRQIEDEREQPDVEARLITMANALGVRL